ncbi:MAG: hypothetical protein ACYTGL_15335 [Planctomycetota bacterium]
MTGSPAAVLGVMVATPVCVWLAIVWQQCERYRKARLRFEIKRAEICHRFLQSDAHRPEVSLLPQNSADHSTKTDDIPRTLLLLAEGSTASGRDMTATEAATTDRQLEDKTLVAELKRLELDYQHFIAQTDRQKVNFDDWSSLTTNETAVALPISIVAAIALIGWLGGPGFILSVPLAAGFLFAEVALRQRALNQRCEQRKQQFEHRQRELQRQLDAHRQSA